MKAGASFSEAHKEAMKTDPPKQKQRQKQSQSQKIVINLASPRRRTKKPRASATPSSARVLAQFIQPQQVLPDTRTMINPMDMPQSFNTAFQSPVIRNPERPRATVTTPNQPQETPLEVSNVMKSVSDVDRLLSGRRPPDTPATEGRTLLTPSQLRSVSAAKAVARDEDRKIKKRLERDQEAERALMGAEDASSFMTQGAMSNPDPYTTPLQPVMVTSPTSSPMSDPFEGEVFQARKGGFSGRQLRFM